MDNRPFFDLEKKRPGMEAKATPCDACMPVGFYTVQCLSKSLHKTLSKHSDTVYTDVWFSRKACDYCVS